MCEGESVENLNRCHRSPKVEGSVTEKIDSTDNVQRDAAHGHKVLRLSSLADRMHSDKQKLDPIPASVPTSPIRRHALLSGEKRAECA